MNTQNQLIATHSAIPMALMIFFGSFILTGWLPPPSPSLSPEEFAAIFNPDNVMMRIGALILCLFSPLVVTFAAAIATQMKRIEGKFHVMANLQYLVQASGLFLFILPGFIWLAISYRPDTDPELIMVLNDLAWFSFLCGASPTIVQWLAIGIGILGDKSAAPIYPRWIGFLNLWVALGAVCGQLIPFVYQGPFSYNGFFGFWVIATVFFTWVGCMYWATLKAVKKQAAEEVK